MDARPWPRECLVLIYLSAWQACFGHSEGAAGIVGLLLAACLLQHGLAPPVMGLQTVNPYVGFALMERTGPNKLLLPRQPASLCPPREGPLTGQVMSFARWTIAPFGLS